MPVTVGPVTVGPVTVGLDIGTTAIKAVAADADGQIVAHHRQPHELLTPSAERFEHDALQSWHHGLLQAWGQVAAGQDVRGVCVAAMVPSLAGLDAQNRPCTPGLLYGDVRGCSEENLAKAPIENGEFLGFLKWLAANYPEAERYGPAQAVGNAALGGEPVLDTASAITAMPVFNGANWDADVCEPLGVATSQLPRLVPGYDPAGEVSPANTAGCHNPNTAIPLAGGSIDALAEQLTADASQPGDVLVVLGATLLCWQVMADWVEVDRLWTVPHSQPGLTLLGGPSNAGGIFINYLASLLDTKPGHSPTSNHSLELHDPANIPVWQPYIRGERIPLHNRSLRASLHHLNLTHGPDELRRAGYEASGFVIRHQLELASQHSQPPNQPSNQPQRIIATGGGTCNPDWAQAIADATGLPVECSAIAEGAALGAAFLARVTAGLEADPADIARWRQTGASYEPRPDWQAACEERYASFKALTYTQLAEL